MFRSFGDMAATIAKDNFIIQDISLAIRTYVKQNSNKQYLLKNHEKAVIIFMVSFCYELSCISSYYCGVVYQISMDFIYFTQIQHRQRLGCCKDHVSTIK